MPYIHQKEIFKVNKEKAFNIVKDFEKYPDFLPWCKATRLKSCNYDKENKEVIIADIVISYKVFCETLTTKVVCDNQNHHIDIKLHKGPFKKLNSFWKFTEDEDKSCTKIEFMIDFEVNSKLFQKVLSLFFEDAMRNILNAFEKRFESDLQ